MDKRRSDSHDVRRRHIRAVMTRVTQICDEESYKCDALRRALAEFPDDAAELEDYGPLAYFVDLSPDCYAGMISEDV